VKQNYLASPPLVVAYALAGTARHRPEHEPLGTGTDGKAGVPEGHLAEPRRKSPTTVRVHHLGDVQAQLRRASSTATNWRAIKVPAGPLYAWDAEVHLREEPALLRRHDDDARQGASDITGARVLGCSATRSPPTTSRPPATSRQGSPAGEVPEGPGRAEGTSTPTARGAATMK
jgi:aconitate hydratase